MGHASALPALSFLPGLLVQALDAKPESPLGTSATIKYGLFFGDDKLASIRTVYNENPLYSSLSESIRSFDYDAEYNFLKDEIQYNDHLIDLPRIGNKAPEMAFHYLMTGDEDAARMAVALIDAIMQFEKWDYFLEDRHLVIGLQRASSSAVGIALTSDWLGDFVPEDKRRQWISTMGDKGCEPCFRATYGMRYPTEVIGWTMDETSAYFEHRPGQIFDLSNWPYILNSTNLKAVPASALAIAAAAYELELGRSNRTDRWVEQAAFSIASFGDIYEEDGSYNENLSYANYTSEHLAQGMDVLSRLRGIELQDEINWAGFVDFMFGMAMPTNNGPADIVNFGDAGNGMMSAVPFWIAGQIGDPRAAWFGRNLARDHNLWSVLWHTDMPGMAPKDGPSLYRSELDWLSVRSGYSTDDLVVAMRSGGPSNHEHADRNSIIIKCHGEVLVADPYRPPYANTDISWPLRLSTGHSALTIDGLGHQYHDGKEGTNPSDAHAKIVRVLDLGDVVSWSSDATQAYQLVNEDIQSVVRTVVVLHDGNSVIVIDKVTKKSVASKIGARYYAKNVDGNGKVVTGSEALMSQAQIVGNGSVHSGADSFVVQRQGENKDRKESTDNVFAMRRPSAGLVGYGYSPSGVMVSSGVLDIDPERASQHPFADVATANASTSAVLISVLIPHLNNSAPKPVTFLPREDGTIAFRIANKRVQIFDKGPIPEFMVS